MARKYLPNTKIEKRCPICENTFLSAPGPRVYCSDKCFRASRGCIELQTLTCPNCHTPFQQTKWSQQYCSPKCQSAHYNLVHDIPGRLRARRMGKSDGQ